MFAAGLQSKMFASPLPALDQAVLADVTVSVTALHCPTAHQQVKLTACAVCTPLSKAYAVCRKSVH